MWNNSTLNDLFKAYWSSLNQAEFQVLNDQEAGPAHPMPYCVFHITEGNTTDRMTGNSNGSNNRFEIRDIPIEFKVHARSMSGKTAKLIASELAAEIIKIFGGHPTERPTLPTFDHGACLKSTYKTDFGIREGDQEHCWHVKYVFSCDIPVAA